jgi:predicted acetyltransferase
VIDTVTLTEVPANQRHVITNLIQLYKYDFSEFAGIGSPYGEVGADGRYIYDGLDSYWREEGRYQWSALNRPLDHAVGEFFVLRKYGRIGVGSRAAKILFKRWPGRWEVAVAWYNKPAQSFWRKAIAAAVERDAEECAGDGKRWAGPVLCFDSRRRPAVLCRLAGAAEGWRPPGGVES